MGDNELRAMREKFHEEIRLLSSLRHENILTFMGVSVSGDDIPWLLTERCDGTLFDLIDGCPMPVQQVTSIAMGIARALAYIHAIPIAHRDLNSKNVLMQGFTAKLAGTTTIPHCFLRYVP